MLELRIRGRLEKKAVLLMAHTVLGYPSCGKSLQIMKTLVEAGADILELQIPFTDPVADGPLILRANERAMENGASVAACVDLAVQAGRNFPVPVVVMTYYNVVYRFGVYDLVKTLEDGGVSGILVPDIPPEEAQCLFDACGTYGLAPVLTVSPTTPQKRLREIASDGRGFLYCVARRGVTGGVTDFSSGLSDYISECRKATDLPLAVGFGVAHPADVEFLLGKAEIAVVGTELIRRFESGGLEELSGFVGSLQVGDVFSGEQGEAVAR